MAEGWSAGFGDEPEHVQESVNELSYDALHRGVIFNADIESDFFLRNDVEPEEEDVEGAGLDEVDLSWTPDDPNRATVTMDYFRTAPVPYKVLWQDMFNLVVGGGVKKMVLEYSMSNSYPPPGSKLLYHYSAWLDGAQDPFDTSVGRNAESLIAGAEGEVLKGVRLAVESMKIHEVSQFIFFPEYAYGKLGCPPRVGKDEKVIFTIKLVHVIKKDRLKNDLKLMTPMERNALPFAEVLTKCTYMRRAANLKFGERNYYCAIREYRSTINIMEGYSGINNQEEENERIEFICGLYCNLAHSYIKLEKGPQACSACNNAIRYKVAKLMHRIYLLCARAQAIVGSYPKALDYLKKCRKYGGNEDQCKLYEDKFAEAKIQSEKAYADMCKRMFNFGTSDKPGPSSATPEEKAESLILSPENLIRGVRPSTSAHYTGSHQWHERDIQFDFGEGDQKRSSAQEDLNTKRKEQ